MKLIIIIPAYNEEKTIQSVIKRIPQDIPGIDKKEIIVIDDGSSDDTVCIARESGAQVISHQTNQGVGAAFQTGIKQALMRKADVVVNIDGDGQFDSRDIPKLIGPILEGKADLITGSRFFRKGFIPQNMPKIKILGNKIVSKVVSRLINKKVYDVTCGFRAYSKEAILKLNLFEKFTYTQEVLLDLEFKGLKIAEIPIKVQYFSDRKSKVTKNLFRYIIQISKIILKTYKDYKPLRFFGTIGIFTFLTGVGLDIFVLIHFLRTWEFTPYKWVGAIGVFLNILGFGFFILGLLADMLSRLRMNQEELLYYQKKKFYDEERKL